MDLAKQLIHRWIPRVSRLAEINTQRVHRILLKISVVAGLHAWLLERNLSLVPIAGSTVGTADDWRLIMHAAEWVYAD